MSFDTGFSKAEIFPLQFCLSGSPSPTCPYMLLLFWLLHTVFLLSSSLFYLIQMARQKNDKLNADNLFNIYV